MKAIFQLCLVCWIALIAFLAVLVALVMPELKRAFASVVILALVFWGVWALTAYSLKGQR